MGVKRLKTLALEVFKTLNNMNPEYMKEIFHKTAFSTYRPLNLEANENQTTKCENENLRCVGPHIWNSLPNQMKCKCNLCFFFYLSARMSILYC